MKYLYIFVLMLILNIETYSELHIISGEKKENGYFSPGQVFEIDQNSNYLQNKIYVKTKEAIDPSILISSDSDFKISYPFAKFTKNDRVLNKSNLDKIALIEFENKIDVIDICNELNSNVNIIYAVPESIQQLRYIPNDPEYNSQYYLELIEVQKAWDIVKGDEEILIAIVDSGVDALHEDLRDNIWQNPGEIADNGIDDDQNGYVDDVKGWDFVGDITPQQAYNTNWQEDNNVTPKNSSNWHGTHVAGIASASTDNGKGIAGVSFNCKILPIKVTADNIDLKKGGTNAVFRGYEGILYAAEMGADIINVSWGTYNFNPLEQDILIQAQAYGALIVAAVGNDAKLLEAGSNDYPAMYPGVVAVGATNTNGKRSNYSNQGMPVDIFAPGNSILSTKPLDYYDTEQGTSMATPVVSGIAALLLSQKTDLSPKQLHHQLRSYSKIFDDNQERKSTYYGVVNALNSITGQVLPGISVDEVSMTYQYGFINNYDTNKFIFELTNYLADAKNVSIKITAKDNSLEKEKIYNVGDILSGNSIELEYEFQLGDNFPWYYKKIPFEIEIIADNYHDFELIEQTVLLPTYNQFRVTQEFEGFNISWIDSHSPNFDDFWAIGYDNAEQSGVILSYVNNGTVFLKTQPFQPNSIFVDNNNEAYLTSATGQVLKTSNRGESYFIINDDYKSVDDIYAADEIYFVGTNDNDQKKLVKTVDNEWQEVYDVPDNYQFIEYYNDHILIVYLENGELSLIFSNDNAENFNKKGISEVIPDKLIDVEFINESLVALTSKVNENINIFYIKVNTGEIVNQYQYEIEDHTLYSPHDSDELYAMNFDLSTNLINDPQKAVISLNHYPVQVVSGSEQCGRMRLWNLGKDLSYLEFDYEPKEKEYILELQSSVEIIFDSLDIDNEDTDFVMLENKGNSRIYFEDFNIEGSDAFSINSEKPFSIAGCDLESFFIKFNPKTPGYHEATLNIITDPNSKEIAISLKGFAYDPASVIEYDDDAKIYPNPADKELNIELPEIYDPNVNIYNSIGEIKNFEYSYSNELLIINTSELPSGSYHAIITYGNKSKRVKFVVLR